MTKKRIKSVSGEQFEEIMKLNWKPVKFAWEDRPDVFRNMPKDVTHSIYASGIELPSVSYSDPAVPGASLVGAYEVFRNAPDDPVELNKDHYRVVVMPGGSSMFLVLGPFKDDEHWLDSVPERYEGAEVFGLGISASKIS